MDDQSLIEILLRMEENQQKFFSEALTILKDGEVKPKKTDPDNWWTPEKTLNYLGCSIRTLYTLRQTNEVTWTRKRGKYRYFYPSLVEIRNRYLK